MYRGRAGMAPSATTNMPKKGQSGGGGGSKKGGRGKGGGGKGGGGSGGKKGGGSGGGVCPFKQQCYHCKNGPAYCTCKW